MFSRQNIWFQVAVALVTAFFIWLACGESAEAGVIGSGTVTLDDKEIVYYYADYFEYTYVVGSTTYYFEFFSDVPIYWFLVRSSNSSVYFHYFSMEDVEVTRQRVSKSGTLQEGPWTHNMYADENHFCQMLSITCTDSDFVINEISNSGVHALFCSYFVSDGFKEIKSPTYVQTASASSDISFALSNVKGYIQDSMFYASWTAPLGVGEDSGDMPVILDFVVEDLDSTETINASLVAYPPMDDSLPDSPYGTRITYYDVKDLGLSVDLTTIENLPTNYRIIGANLTPYYYRDLISLEGLSLCKGQTSMVALDYTGQYKNTIQVSPDDVIDAENTDLTIMGMISNFFSGFFNNFLDMLKRAFVPTTEDMNDLLGRMQAWFSDRLGFLWYPFDIAFDIVDALAEGERNSELKVPALVINLSSVGTYTIWEELTIDFDQMGIFEYVRFFTSCSLCCGVAVLAINKFDEWIGGHVHANGGDFWK